ncbi:MAG: polyribonucleotide nucleotidyltransferase [Microthrixaceae bacterium]|nr:polyribonucleotide nucleotidyltransferase [Microthrixaceae bacterium]
MAEPIRVEADLAGDEFKHLSFEAGKYAGLADGSVMVGLGETRVLVTATAARQPRPGADFFPLTVDIEERMYAAGKIPGSFFRREARAGEQAILTCRLIDRPLRPSFPAGFRNEVHVVGTVMGADQENPYDVAAINGASAALMLSGIAFDGPIGAVRLAYTTDGEWLAHPTYTESDAATFEIVVAGRQLDSGDIAVMMVEAGGTEKSWGYFEEGAPKVDEAALATALEECKPHISAVIELQKELVKTYEATHGAIEAMPYSVTTDYDDDVYAAVEAAAADKMVEVQSIADKSDRIEAEEALRAELIESLVPGLVTDDRDEEAATKQVKGAVRGLTKATVRSRIVNDGVRIDGRGPTDIRPLSAEVSVIPTAHGTGLFQRGDTQVLNFCTLGMQRMDQMVDGIDPQTRKRYMHHYNFPPFSTGEPGFMRGPKRREIGHGALAERAVFPVVPSLEDFPYTIRLVSEVLSSNGSSSMASVCASSLSLMDAGVPIKAPVAGIAMGLVYADGKYTTLTDILGAEDAFGDMDFKIAGTSDVVTALQLDTKIDGIPADVLAAALNQARDARLEILGVMAEALDGPRPELAETAPKIISIQIPADKIGEVIGPKGKVINAIQAETGADISVDDDGEYGIVAIAAVDMGAVNEAERQIKLILDPPTAEVGAVYPGKVVNITKFGAFVNILPGRDGLVHISKLGGGRRINKVEDVLELGQDLEVTVDDIDPNGKISLTPTSDADPKASEGGATAANGSTEGDTDDRSSESTEAAASSSGNGGGRSRSADRGESSGRGGRGSDDADGRREASFSDSYDEVMAAKHGDLGPASSRGRGGRGGGGRGGSRGRSRR